MGAEFSTHDFTACSSHPAGSRVSFAYTPSNFTGSAPSLKTPLSSERVKSAPATGRLNNAPAPADSPTTSNGRGQASPIKIPSSSSQAEVSTTTNTSVASTPVTPSRSSRKEYFPTASAASPAMQNGFQQSSQQQQQSRIYSTSIPATKNSTTAVDGCYSNSWKVAGGTAGAMPSWSDPSDTSDSEAPPSSAKSGGSRNVSESPRRVRQQKSLPEVMSSPQCHCACHGKDGIGALRQELRQTKLELEHSRQQIASLKQNESNLMQRLSEQARRQLEKSSTKFEDLSLGDKRPTQLIRRYGNLYTESRLEALDALDEIAEMSEFADLKGKLLLTILVLSFRNARKNLLSVKVQVRRLLHIPELLGVQFARTSLASSDAAAATAAFDSRGSTLAPDPAVKELDDVISVYLRKTVDRFDLTRNYEEVCERVWDTLFDFPRLRHCSGLLHYIDDCVRLAWALTVQNPPFNINFEHTYFSPDLHTRFHTSDPASDVIRSVLWPVLTEGDNGPCVYKGVVVT